MKLYTLFLTIIFCFCFSKPLKAQTKIHGAVKNPVGKPVQYVNVFMVKSADSSLVKGALTDANGKFSFENIKNGRYKVAAVFTGMEKLYSPILEISPEKTDINMGVLNLKYDSAQLANVTVSANRKPLFEQKIDRMVINVAK
jgi:hypothetical protein